jgi:hypothetical protein
VFNPSNGLSRDSSTSIRGDQTVPKTDKSSGKRLKSITTGSLRRRDHSANAPKVAKPHLTKPGRHYFTSHSRKNYIRQRRLAEEAVSHFNQAIDGLPRKGREAFRKAASALEYALYASEQAPASLDEMRKAVQALETGLAKLDKATTELRTSGGPEAADVLGQFDAASRKLREVHHYNLQLLGELDRRAEDTSTVSENKLFGVMSLWAQAAESLIEEKLVQGEREGTLNNKQAAILENALVDVRSHRLDLDTKGSLEDMTPDEIHEKRGSPLKGALTHVPGQKAKDKAREEEAAEALFENVDFSQGGIELPNYNPAIREQVVLAALVNKAFVQAGVFFPKEVLGELTARRRQILNTRPWNTIEGSLTLKDVNGRNTNVGFVSTPQAQLGKTFEKRVPLGTNSHETTTSRCPTAYKTLAKVEKMGVTTSSIPAFDTVSWCHTGSPDRTSAISATRLSGNSSEIVMRARTPAKRSTPRSSTALSTTCSQKGERARKARTTSLTSCATGRP